MGYMLQEPLQMELERMCQEEIIVPLGVDEAEEWCNSFVPVSNHNRTVWPYLNAARLNQVLIRPVQRGSTINDILHRLICTKYFTLIDDSLGYYNLTLDNKSYLTSCPHQCDRYRYTTLLFGTGLVGQIFQ